MKAAYSVTVTPVCVQLERMNLLVVQHTQGRGCGVLGVTLGGLYNRHYFMQLLPLLCLLAAAGLVRIVRLAHDVAVAGLLLVIPLAALGMTAQTDAPFNRYMAATLPLYWDKPTI